MILFLDFDGVLHPEPCHDGAMLFCNRPALETILRDIPTVEIVISSMWRFKHTLAELQAVFSADVAQRIVGVTPDWTDISILFSVVRSYLRHAEVEGRLRQSDRAGEAWVAQDDRRYLFQPQLPNLICCDPLIGLDHGIEPLPCQKPRSAC